VWNAARGIYVFVVAVRWLQASISGFLAGGGKSFLLQLARKGLSEPGHLISKACASVEVEVPSRARKPPVAHVGDLPVGRRRWAAGSRLRRHRAGGKLGLGDSLIAGVAAELGATVVTRNRPDFERQGIDVLTY
jgi:hypothetical protein